MTAPAARARPGGAISRSLSPIPSSSGGIGASAQKMAPPSCAGAARVQFSAEIRASTRRVTNARRTVGRISVRVSRMTKTEEFLHDVCPSRQDERVAVWRARNQPQLSVAVIQYSGESTFTARAMYTSIDRSHAVTTIAPLIRVSVTVNPRTRARRGGRGGCFCAERISLATSSLSGGVSRRGFGACTLASSPGRCSFWSFRSAHRRRAHSKWPYRPGSTRRGAAATNRDSVNK